jgi:NADPH:quinone reductase-like Zn-dependent oxidoreductase
MRAVSQDRLGPPGVLHMVTVPRPEPGGTEVLVRVLAAGVNPVDWKTRAGGGLLGPPPFILGWDVAGVVAALGQGVARSAAPPGQSHSSGLGHGLRALEWLIWAPYMTLAPDGPLAPIRRSAPKAPTLVPGRCALSVMTPAFLACCPVRGPAGRRRGRVDPGGAGLVPAAGPGKDAR